MRRLISILIRFGLLVAPALLVSTACAPPTAPPVPVPTVTVFDPATVAWSLVDGQNEIRGQGFLRQRGGGVVTCAGEEAFLIPRGPYAEERIRNIYGQTTRPARAIALADVADWRYEQSVRRTLCDADGRFAFTAVADGLYFVVTSVTWEAATGEIQGGPIMAPVEVIVAP